jgi:hypothetical protein
MSDQCQHCIVCGDFDACCKTECFHHENWYAVQLMEEIHLQDMILDPGDGINEQDRDGMTVCVLRKDLWDIKSLRERDQLELKYIKAGEIAENLRDENTLLRQTVKLHIADLNRCVEIFRSNKFMNTAGEIERAIKELEIALEAK